MRKSSCGGQCKQEQDADAPKKEASAKVNAAILVLAMAQFSKLYGMMGDRRRSSNSFHPSISIACNAAGAQAFGQSRGGCSSSSCSSSRQQTLSMTSHRLVLVRNQTLMLSLNRYLQHSVSEGGKPCTASHTVL